MNSFHLILMVALETAPAASNSNAYLIIGCSLAGSVIFTAAIVFGLLFSSASKFCCYFRFPVVWRVRLRRNEMNARRPETRPLLPSPQRPRHDDDVGVRRKGQTRFQPLSENLL